MSASDTSLPRKRQQVALSLSHAAGEYLKRQVGVSVTMLYYIALDIMDTPTCLFRYSPAAWDKDSATCCLFLGKDVFEADTERPSFACCKDSSLV